MSRVKHRSIKIRTGMPTQLGHCNHCNTNTLHVYLGEKWICAACSEPSGY